MDSPCGTGPCGRTRSQEATAFGSPVSPSTTNTRRRTTTEGEDVERSPGKSSGVAAPIALTIPSRPHTWPQQESDHEASVTTSAMRLLSRLRDRIEASRAADYSCSRLTRPPKGDIWRCYCEPCSTQQVAKPRPRSDAPAALCAGARRTSRGLLVPGPAGAGTRGHI
jgi:hypothetical protein